MLNRVYRIVYLLIYLIISHVVFALVSEMRELNCGREGAHWTKGGIGGQTLKLPSSQGEHHAASCQSTSPR
jgi:hypothetical protein